MKTKTIFDIFNSLTFEKVQWKDLSESDRKSVQPYMLNRLLSMNLDFIDFIAEVQPITDSMTSEQYYKFYLDILPKKKTFNKYIKSKTELDTNQDKILKVLSERFNISKVEAKNYLQLPNSKHMIKEFLHGMGYTDKQCKGEFGL